MATARTHKRRIERIREKGLHWSAHAMFMSGVERQDGRSLALQIVWGEKEQRYTAIGIEAGNTESVESVFDDHGHRILGTFESEIEARQTCLDYALLWMEYKDAVDACECEAI